MDTGISLRAKCLQAFRELIRTFSLTVCQGASTRWRRTACLWTMSSVRTCSRKTSGTWCWRPCKSSSPTTSPGRQGLWASAPHRWFTTSTHRYHSCETRVELKCCWVEQQSWWSSTNYWFRATPTVLFFFCAKEFFRDLKFCVFSTKVLYYAKWIDFFWVEEVCLEPAGEPGNEKVSHFRLLHHSERVYKLFDWWHAVGSKIHRAAADGWSVFGDQPHWRKKIFNGVCRKRALISTENGQKQSYKKICPTVFNSLLKWLLSHYKGNKIVILWLSYH